MSMLSGVAEPLLDDFALAGTSLLYSDWDAGFNKSAAPACTVSVAVTRVARSSHGDATDPLGIGNQ
jgi:hypothetical protein